MHPDFYSLALGLGLGIVAAVVVTQLLYGEALAAAKTYQRNAAAALEREQRAAREAYEREQDYKQAERVAAILRNIAQTRSAESLDGEINPQKARDGLETEFWKVIEQAEAAQARADRIKHIMNYKSNKDGKG